MTKQEKRDMAEFQKNIVWDAWEELGYWEARADDLDFGMLEMFKGRAYEAAQNADRSMWIFSELPFNEREKLIREWETAARECGRKTYEAEQKTIRYMSEPNLTEFEKVLKL